jgi:hypothetical protein
VLEAAGFAHLKIKKIEPTFARNVYNTDTNLEQPALFKGLCGKYNKKLQLPASDYCAHQRGC